jgi:hypothetical protein
MKVIPSLPPSSSEFGVQSFRSCTRRHLITTHLVLARPKVWDVGNVHHILGNRIKLSICPSLSGVCVLERVNLETFVWIQSKVPALESVMRT